METVRDVCGYLLGLAFCVVAAMMCYLAWTGLEDMFGWRWALGGVVVGIVARINLAVPVGLYFYGLDMLGLTLLESLAVALPGLLIITPAIATEVFGLFVGTAARR